MYVVVCTKWLRDSTQNAEFVVWSGTRRKEAYGQAKHHFNSHIEMMLRHRYLDYAYDWDIDRENLWVALADDESINYYFHWEVREWLTKPNSQ